MREHDFISANDQHRHVQAELGVEKSLWHTSKKCDQDQDILTCKAADEAVIRDVDLMKSNTLYKALQQRVTEGNKMQRHMMREDVTQVTAGKRDRRWAVYIHQVRMNDLGFSTFWLGGNIKTGKMLYTCQTD